MSMGEVRTPMSLNQSNPMGMASHSVSRGRTSADRGRLGVPGASLAARWAAIATASVNRARVLTSNAQN